jgi:hypothetical protein
MQQAQADISRQYSAAEAEQQRALNRAGVNPTSGKALMAGQQGEVAEADARSRAGLMVSEAAKKEGLQLHGQAAGILAGAPAQAASLTPSGAALGVGGLDVANKGAAGMNAGLTAADAAVSEYGKSAGDQWSSANKLYLAGKAADDERSAEMIGSGIGLAGMAGYTGVANYGKTGQFWNGGSGRSSNFNTGLSKIGANLGWGGN